MQTLNLIIPMAGAGKRFIIKNYKTYKTLLNVDNNNTVYDRIISNFKTKKIRITVILNKNIYSKFKNKFNKKNVKLIFIESHNSGPLYTLFKASFELNKLIKKDESFFVCYGDINWKWDLKKVLKFIKNKDACVFTHKGFHPHLEVNSKSDFCKIKKNNVVKILQKKKFSKDYKKDYLAIGCYYFKKIQFLNDFFQQKKLYFKKKEYYLLSLINHLIKNKIKVSIYNIDKFVHLGTPDQFEDFISWKIEISNNFYIKRSNLLNNNPCIMLMAGQGKRLKKINSKKFLLTYKNFEIYKYILKMYNAKKNIIITNNHLKNQIPKNNNTELFFVKKNNSMFQTILESSKLLKNYEKYLLTSCDCHGDFDLNELQMISKKNIDLCMFGFQFTNLQKNLNNAHTQIIVKNNTVSNIKVKAKFDNKLLGHAGFFWINSNKVFSYIDVFLRSKYYKLLKREIIIDDYFKFIINNKLINASFIKLKNYIHIGSLVEYQEYEYWHKYFK